MKVIKTLANTDWGARVARLWARQNGLFLKDAPWGYEVKHGRKHIGNLFPTRMGFKFIGIPTDDELKNFSFNIDSVPDEFKQLIL